MIGDFFYVIMRHTIKFYIWLTHNKKVYNEEKLPHKLPEKLKGGYIIACNHQSYTDPPAIVSVVRGRFALMAKAELFEGNPFFAWLIRKCGAFPVVRGAGDRSAIDKSLEQLEKGRTLVIFPEGTRSKDGKIGRGKSGIALIAGTANVPVLPVCIMYGLDGNKKTIDFAVGDIIPAETTRLPENFGIRDLRRISASITDRIKELQKQILTERGLPFYDE